MTQFPAIRTEGGLLGPELLDQVCIGDLPGQKPADFGLEPGRSLTDEIAAAFADTRALWGVFQNRLNRLPADDLATTATRDAWVIPFLGVLGYEPRYNPRAIEVDGLSFAVSHRADEAEDAPPIHIVGARQELGRLPPSGRPRLAPHTLLQEFLNRTEHLWGIVTNGLTLRLLRDCTFIRRQAYVEFDLQAICDGQRYTDFAVLYRLLHRSRLPRGQADAGECLLERYHDHAVEQGGRVRRGLAVGVRACLGLLANGFLQQPANGELRRRFSATGSERITADDCYRQLLRLVYRFLFLMVCEDRGLLGASAVYCDHYSLARLRRLVDRRTAFTNHDDLWYSLRVLWLVLIKDESIPTFGDKPMASALGLPVLNGELFAPQYLDMCALSNRDLLSALWHLCWYKEKPADPPRRVNYAALDVEELGSVYESLLEFHPIADSDGAGRPLFKLLEGSERKTTGSYYTPPELVGELVRSALEPVIRQRMSLPEDQRENALLGIRVCDLACGSGHFLLAAARRIGRELARVRTGADEPAPEQVRAAVRDVICHCIYGVDKNPLAVDLCRVALWLEGHTADMPLTFLDHRIRCGDSLVGVFDLNVLKDGIPDEAFKPLEGDDKPTARVLAKQNREERRGQGGLFDVRTADLDEFNRQARAVDAITDDSPEAIRSKKQLFEHGHAEPAWQWQKLACDLWTAAFFQPLAADRPAITSRVLADHLAGRQVVANIVGLAAGLSARQRFFHWPLEFPEVFADGGFDVLLSNPPWERIKLQEQEFFASLDARIATAANKAARTRLIRELAQTNPDLYREFQEAMRSASAASSFMRHSGRYPLTGRGDINTYAVFAELAATVARATGRTGLILPKGIATDDTTKYFFASLVDAGRLIELIGFENEEFIFPAVDHRVTFCTFTIGGTAVSQRQSRIAFYIRRFPQLSEETRFFSLTRDEFWLLNPNTGNCPIFRGQADAELTKAIYRRVPVLWREATEDQPEENPWRVWFKTLFHMANDSYHFRIGKDLEADGYRLEGNVYVSPYDRFLPLVEAKMLHQFDHRFSTYEGATEKQLNVGILPQPTAEQKRDPSFVVQPRYWVRAEIAESAIPDGLISKWFLGWRETCRATDQRTLIASLVPRTAIGNKFLLAFSEANAIDRSCLLAAMNSFVEDYCARQKLGGTSFSYFVLRQLPIAPPAMFANACPWAVNTSWGSWLFPRILELVYTAFDLSPMAHDCGYDGPPFVWNDDRRFAIRCELDAAFFHLYLPADADGRWRAANGENPEQVAILTGHFRTPRDAVTFVMEQFPQVRKKDEEDHGRYRTREQILEVYDAMLAAQRIGREYESALTPAPGKALSR